MDDASNSELLDRAYGQGLGYRILSAQSQVREVASKFYESVALLNGGTVALAITAVFNKTPPRIPHPASLKIGLVCMTLAMLLLFARNFCRTRYEAKVTEMKFSNPTIFRALIDSHSVLSAQRWLEVSGLLLTASGMFVLLYVATTLF